MGWKLKVTEYGKIGHAEIEMAPLTLFVGDNNSGKSYLMALLWGIRNLGAEVLFQDSADVKSEAEKRLLSWLEKQVDMAMAHGSHIAGISEIAEELQVVLQDRIACNQDRFVKTIFNSQDVKIGELQIELTDLEKISLCFEFDVLGGREGIFLRIGNGHAGYGTFFSEKEQRTGKPEQATYRCLAKEMFALLLYDGQDIPVTLNRHIYLPAARTGFMLTKDVVNKVGRMAAFNIGFEKESLVPFIKPINQFLDVINDLTLDGEGNEYFGEVIRYLEKDMADGTVEMSALPNREVSYVPNGAEGNIPLRAVSAVVTELSPLILILKHKSDIDTLFYEEPEMCLHPQLQQKMARVICMLVNAGVQMNVTTHSDLILQHINNMIRLSSREDAEEICRQFGYGAPDLMSPDKVRVYQLVKASGKSTVEALACGRNGFTIPTFNDALDKIMDEAYVIQE